MADDFWNDRTIAKLRKLWGEGLSTAEIGRQMNITKNSVVSKAHRLNLPPRPSPIRRAGEAREAREAQPRKLTPAVSRSLARLKVDEAFVAPVREAKPLVGMKASTRACQWPYGHPKDAGFRFCEAPSDCGKPYCAEHCDVAYVKKYSDTRELDTREDA